ncbi:MAG: hypothetical protein ACNA7U_01255 [Candidatus Izemoplasmataceae bacterium]
MKVNFWNVVGVGIITSIVVNGVVNTTSRIRRNKLEDQNYQEEILRKKEERLAKKAAKSDKKQITVAAEEA